MTAEQCLDLIAYLCNTFLRRSPDDPAKAEQIVRYLEQRGLTKKPDPEPPNALVAELIAGQQLLEARDVAEILGVHESWVRVHYKELPHILIGANSRPRVRFRRKALLAWIEQHEIDWRKKR